MNVEELGHVTRDGDSEMCELNLQWYYGIRRRRKTSLFWTSNDEQV